MDSRRGSNHDVRTPFQSPTFDRDVQIRVNETVGSASISPSGRDVVLASAEGLHIIDLDSPYSPPRHLAHQQQWPPADVQWSPFASRAYWIASTSNQKALIWNLDLYNPHSPIQHILHAHSRAITDINFSAHHPDMLATCAVDSYVHCWDLRRPGRPVMTFADWNAGATQVKWNRQDEHILASSHDKFLKIWDDRKGAYPLKTIQAHTTKIYGIDWNRTRPTGILTCSLDKSIKFWDYSKADDKPERVIRTDFPVWRARHTPFGWGVLALPQRSDFHLHLYDRRLVEGAPRVGFAKAVHSFEGHTSHVKEFLWRSRGGVIDGKDERDFQLISWGMDRDLHLHRIDPHVLASVGFEKGAEVRKNLPFTRKGAVYTSYREYKPEMSRGEQVAAMTAPERRQGLLGHLVTDAGMSRMPLPMAPVGRDSGFMTYSGRSKRRTVNPIKWMEGVTMGSRQTDPTNRAVSPDGNSEALSNEMTTVSQRYTKVNFEKADVHARVATIALNGPWGPEEKPVFLRINFDFPVNYPSSAAAICKLEKTAAGISDELMMRLHMQVKSIIGHYQLRKTGCLDAVITYLLGERGLEESITLPEVSEAYDIPSPGEDSSSDEDDGIGGPGQDMATNATDALGVSSGQANVPLPKACGAFWSQDGRLVCFFPPKPEPKPLFSLDTLRAADRGNRSRRQFEGFGRLLEESPSSKGRFASDNEEKDDDSAGSWSSSSSSTSDDSAEDVTRLPPRFRPPQAWRAAALRFQKTSSHSSGTHRRSEVVVKPKSYVVIHDFSNILPTKFELAEGYQVFGKGPVVCAHNAALATRHGYHDLAAIWEIASHVLYDEVPLEIMEQTMRKEPILVLAKRSIVRTRRKDSGLDLAFDEPYSVSEPKLTGRVKWGQHPLGSAWLIPEFFDHFEKLADVQMLAMLSCVFCEPAAREGVSNALTSTREEDLPIPMKAPAFSLDYFPSREIAWSLFKDTSSKIAVSPTLSRYRPWNDFGSRFGTTYGSAGSSNGPWMSDLMPSTPHTPYSTGTTPPVFPFHSHRHSSVNSMSTSPEQQQQHNRVARRSNSNLSAALSSFSRPFATLASSPSTHDRFRPDSDLSTSAPATAVTWGSTTFFSGSSSVSPEKRKREISKRSSIAGYDSTYDSSSGSGTDQSDDSEDEAIIQPMIKPSNTRTIKVTLKNQHLFDEEAHASVPLLPPENNERYAAYREIYANQLSVWGLYIQRAEILKFNGLTNYWPNKTADRQQRLEQASTAGSSFPGPTADSLVMKGLQQTADETAGIPLTRSDLRPVGWETYQHNLSHRGVFGPSSDPEMRASSIREEERLHRRGDERNKMLDNVDIVARAQLPGDQPLLATERSGASCSICKERILGIYLICPNDTHRAHWDCHQDELRKCATRFAGPIGCACPGNPPYAMDSSVESIEYL